MGFYHCINNNIFVGRPFIPYGFTPFWGGLGAFNSGFNFGMITSLFNFSMPRLQLQPYFPPVQFNNSYSITPPAPLTLPSFSEMQQQNTTFNPFIFKPNLTLPAFDSNNFFNFNTASSSDEESINVTRSIDKGFKNRSKLDKNFLNKVKQIAKKVNCDYKDLLAVMNSESGLNPHAWNGSTAVGLIQFTKIAVDQLNITYGLNLTKAKIAKMSAIEQLDLVEKTILNAKKLSFSPNAKLSAADLYSIVFLPGRADRNVLCVRGENYYNKNEGLDKNKDGKITKNDLARHLAGKYVDESMFV